MAVAVFWFGLGMLAAGFILDPALMKPQILQKSTKPIPIIAGCFLNIDGKAVLIDVSNDSYSFCKNVFLANHFLFKGQRADLFLLLKSLGKTSSITQLALNDAITVTVYHQGQNGQQDNFSIYIQSKLSADKCVELGYWGLPLYCFNEIKGNNPKPSHLSFIIQYLTFLKATWSNQQYPAFDALVNDSVVLVDDSQDICHKGGANHVPGNPPKIELYQSFFDEFKKVHSAGVIYHEAVHLQSPGHYYRKMPDGQCIQNPNISGSSSSGSTELDANGCPVSSGSQGMPADWDIKKNKNKQDGFGVSVYGAQVDYLNSLVSNSDLSCQDRRDAYDDFIFNLGKLCNTPKYDLINPNCN